MVSGIRAIVLDFDGLVLDTETCVYEAWRTVYQEHGEDLPFDRWCEAIGSDTGVFDPLDELRSRVASPLDEDALHRRLRDLRDDRLQSLDAMPGIVDRLAEARASGLAVAVASSSPRAWVEGHLDRLALLPEIDAMATEEDVSAVKPAPDLYLHATRSLGVAPADSVAIEDSPNGVAAARSAGLRCVAVPGPMTRHLCFDGADLRVESLDVCSLADLLAAAVSPHLSGGSPWKSGS